MKFLRKIVRGVHVRFLLTAYEGNEAVAYKEGTTGKGSWRTPNGAFIEDRAIVAKLDAEFKRFRTICWREPEPKSDRLTRHAFQKTDDGFQSLCGGYRLAKIDGRRADRPSLPWRCPQCDAREMILAGSADPLPESR